MRAADAGVASGLVNAAQQVGNSLGAALLNTIAASATATYIADRGASAAARTAGPVHGYTTAFAVGALILGVAAVASLLLIKARREDVAADVGDGTPPEAADGKQETVAELVEAR